MKKIILLAALLLSACTNPNDANEALDDLGMTKIELDGYGWFACSESDFYHTSFKATNPQGKRISGTVCSGLLFKNATVRFN